MKNFNKFAHHSISAGYLCKDPRNVNSLKIIIYIICSTFYLTASLFLRQQNRHSVTLVHIIRIYIVYTGAPVLSLLQHGVFVCENSEFMIKLVILSCQDFTAKCLLQNRCHNQSLPRDNFFRDKDNVSFSDKKVQQMLRTRYRNGFRQTEYIHYTIKTKNNCSPENRVTLSRQCCRVPSSGQNLLLFGRASWF